MPRGKGDRGGRKIKGTKKPKTAPPKQRTTSGTKQGNTATPITRHEPNRAQAGPIRVTV